MTIRRTPLALMVLALTPLGVLVGMTGCGSSSKATSTACTPGAQVECACPGGGKGAQACKVEGTGFGRCQCEVEAVPDAGSGADLPGRDAVTVVDLPGDAPVGVDGRPDLSVIDVNAVDFSGDGGVPVDGPPPPPVQLDYVFERFDLTRPTTSDGTDFARVHNTIVPLLFAGIAADPLLLLASFSDVTPGSSGVVVTLCQGMAGAAGPSCQPASSVMTTASIDLQGRVSTAPVDFGFQIGTQIGDYVFQYRDLVFDGVLEPVADNGTNPPGKLTGTFRAALLADDLCAAPDLAGNPTLSGAIGCPDPTGWLELMDGPVMSCGQDSSVVSCAPSQAAGHNAGELGSRGVQFPVEGILELVGASALP